MPTYAEWNLLDCARCRLTVDAGTLGRAKPVKCPHCDKRVRVEVFPALVRNPAAAAVEDAPVIADESTCFYHSGKKAAVVCDACGRFLCQLCDIEHGSEHLCPSCFERASDAATSPAAATRFVYYDSIALLWAVVGVPFWFLSFVTAPVALYYVVRHWRTPLSVVPRARWRFVVAGLVALAELGVWGAIGLFAFGGVGSA